MIDKNTVYRVDLHRYDGSVEVIHEGALGDDAWAIMHKNREQRYPQHKYYYNVHTHQGVVVVDFGSHSEFYHLVPVDIIG